MTSVQRIKLVFVLVALGAGIAPVSSPQTYCQNAGNTSNTPHSH